MLISEWANGLWVSVIVDIRGNDRIASETVFILIRKFIRNS